MAMTRKFGGDAILEDDDNYDDVFFCEIMIVLVPLIPWSNDTLLVAMSKRIQRTTDRRDVLKVGWKATFYTWLYICLISNEVN